MNEADSKQNPEPERVWLIEVVALPHDAPAHCRVRIALKRMLRGLKLKCVGITSKPTEAKGKPPSV